MSFSVGPGVADALAANNDEARSDERFLILDEGHKISLTFGRDAQYFWYQEDNAVKACRFR